jgi:hypothetical protein
VVNLNFWKAFANNSDRWFKAFRLGQQRIVFEEIDSLLQSFGMEYCFDVTADGQNCHFVLSPEGFDVAAKEIDALVDSAPSIQDWKIFPRRQRKPLRHVRAIVKQLYLVDTEQCRFKQSMNNGFGVVEIFVPAEADMTSEEEVGFANTLLWHALGEDYCMRNQIRSVVKRDVPSNSVAGQLAELVKHLFGDVAP